MRRGVAASLLGVAGVCCVPLRTATAQGPSAPTPGVDNRNQSFFQIVGRDLVQERENLGACRQRSLKGAMGCGQTLFTGSPFHIVVGSLAPQNGVGGGLGFSEVWHPTFCPSWIDFTAAPTAGRRNACHWSLNMNSEALATGNGSWRAGFYVEAARISSREPVVHFPGQPRARHAVRTFGGPSPTVGFHSESSSLNRVYYYGLGPTTTPAARTDFGLSENVTGVTAVVPVRAFWLDRVGLSVNGEANGRFPSLRGSYGDSSPSIETLYTEATAPGLARQPAFVQTAEGARLVPDLPELGKVRLQLNYLVDFQQFVAPSDAHYSFRRLTADLDHRLVLYTRDVGRAPGPPLPGAVKVQPISATRDVTGSISARLLIEESTAKAGSVVPFYFMPTIGGSDINGESILPSYPDYRFRGPNLLLLHTAYEQSLGKVPIGVFFGVDAAKVTLRRNDIDFGNLQRSYSAGLTLHAGGMPVVYLLFAWGGNEGHHFIGTISNTLLGVSDRPSLF